MPTPKMNEAYGEKLNHDPDFRGPRKNRSCTDLLCLFVFLAFLISWVCLGIYAFAVGNLTPVIISLQSSGVEKSSSSTTSSFFDQTVAKILNDLSESCWYIVCGSLGALTISVIYVTLLQWLSGTMVWLSLVSHILILSSGACFCYFKYKSIKNEPDVETAAPLTMNGSLTNPLQTPHIESANFWLIAMIVIGIALVISLLVIVCFWKQIRIAVALIGEGSKAIGSSLTSLVFPLLPWLLETLVIAWAVIVLLYLHSLGKPWFKVEGLNNSTDCVCNNTYKDGEFCTKREWDSNCQSKSGGPCYSVLVGCAFIQRDSNLGLIRFLQVYNFFGFLWGVAFVSGFSQMVLAGVFATWYWTLSKRDVPYFIICDSMITTIRYHVGTIAFGSLLIAICGFIRALIECARKACKSDKKSAINKAFLGCLKRLLTTLLAVLRFISRNAYIMCAIHGTKFTRSAKDAFGLLSRNAIRGVVLNRVTALLFLTSKIVISGLVGGITYYFLKIRSNDKSLNYPEAPIVVVTISSYLIASMFFKVYTMAVETLFLCFCEDFERNDGSADRPYYMSTSLLKILHRKNSPA